MYGVQTERRTKEKMRKVKDSRGSYPVKWVALPPCLMSLFALVASSGVVSPPPFQSASQRGIAETRPQGEAPIDQLPMKFSMITWFLCARAGAYAVAGFALHSDGGGHKSLTLSYDGEERNLGDNYAVSKGKYGTLGMNGREVYKFATREVRETGGRGGGGGLSWGYRVC